MSNAAVRRYPSFAAQESFSGSPAREGTRALHCIGFHAPVSVDQAILALDGLVANHDSLRIAFEDTGNGRVMLFRDVMDRSDWLTIADAGDVIEESAWIEQVGRQAIDIHRSVFAAFVKPKADGGGTVVLAFHHIGSDAGSDQIVVNEFMRRLISAFEGTQIVLSTESRSYEEFVSARQPDAPYFSDLQTKYWKSLLGGGAVTSLATLTEHAAAPSAIPVNELPVLHLAASELEVLEQQTREGRVTVPAVVTAAIAFAAAEVTGIDDVMFTSVVAGRPREFADVTGLFDFRRIYLRLPAMKASTTSELASTVLNQWLQGAIYSRTAYNTRRLRTAVGNAVQFSDVGEIFCNVIVGEGDMPSPSKLIYRIPLPDGVSRSSAITPSPMMGLACVRAMISPRGLVVEVLADSADPHIGNYQIFAAALKKTLSLLISSGLNAKMRTLL